jgi:hypothetical protein
MPSTPAGHTKGEPAKNIPLDFTSLPNTLNNTPSEHSELEDEMVGKRL